LDREEIRGWLRLWPKGYATMSVSCVPQDRKPRSRIVWDLALAYSAEVGQALDGLLVVVSALPDD